MTFRIAYCKTKDGNISHLKDTEKNILQYHHNYLPVFKEKYHTTSYQERELHKAINSIKQGGITRLQARNIMDIIV